MNSKVLIIGETFRVNGGGGITLLNLFKNWNPDNIAVITERIGETSSESECKKFYRLGHLELKIPFPFNYINKIAVSGDVKLADASQTKKALQTKKKTIVKIKTGIEKAYYEILFFLGICNSNYTITVSAQLTKWINEFQPDIIYAQPFRYKDMVFAKELKQKTGLPLAIHIMDDSVSFLNRPNLLYFYWKKKIKRSFEELVESAEIHLSISEAMSKEYFKRYKKRFIPFRNPIDIDSWLPFIKKNWDLNEEIKIIYTGRLAVPNINSLFVFCQVVDKLYTSGFPINLHIYSIDSNPKFASKISDFKSVIIHKAVPSADIPALISKFDFTFLPIDFTEKGIKYAQFSISTKTSEYMISGVPVILFAPKQVALTEYAQKYNCMYSITRNETEYISSSLKELLNNKEMRALIAQNAVSAAKQDSDALIVRRKFKEILNTGF